MSTSTTLKIAYKSYISTSTPHMAGSTFSWSLALKLAQSWKLKTLLLISKRLLQHGKASLPLL